MAGDVYSQAPYVGRGGWSWYTGAAAWLHRAAVGSIFGLQQDAHQLSVTPCLPSHWRRAELTLTREGRSIRFILLRATPTEVELTAQQQQAAILQTGQPVRWLEQVPQACYVIPLPTE
jgi:cyclic beta-1,2-glucan synthetase